MKDFYTPKEVSEILSVHEKTVRRYLRDGVIKAKKLVVVGKSVKMF
jgi:excisionase family DNA binding protein